MRLFLSIEFQKYSEQGDAKLTCKFKFHRGMEFKFASEFKIKKYKK